MSLNIIRLTTNVQTQTNSYFHLIEIFISSTTYSCHKFILLLSISLKFNIPKQFIYLFNTIQSILYQFVNNQNYTKALTYTKFYKISYQIKTIKCQKIRIQNKKGQISNDVQTD